MSLKALSDYTIYSKYAHYRNDKQRREEWLEQRDRVFGMHGNKYASQLEADPELRKMFEEARKGVGDQLVLGSQRALQYAGPAIEKHHDKMYNCAVTYIDRPEAFKQIMFMLLAGCGVGFSVQLPHISKLPDTQLPSKGEKTYQIPDSIEGWAMAFGILMDSFFVGDADNPDYMGYDVQFDYSLIRPKGAPIANKFNAPGPAPLKQSLEFVRSLIIARLASGDQLHSIDYYDCIMHAADAVISGGVRRSATICLFSLEDQEMMKAKTGDWFETNKQRGRSNNSVVLLRDEVTEDQFLDVVLNNVKEFGEPGFVWSDDVDILYNPCVSGDSMVDVKINGDERVIRMDELVVLFDDGVPIEVLSVDVEGDMSRSYKPVTCAAMTREDATLLAIEVEGYVLKCTPDHKVWTHNRGWVEAKDLTTEDDLEINTGSNHHKELSTRKKLKETKKHGKVKSIKIVPNEDVYDITVSDNHNFFANGVLVHNCVEIGFYPKTNDGRSGVQYCNLTEINGGKCKDRETFYHACYLSAIIGTLQAGYDEFPFLGGTTEEIVRGEALLGCSITGMMDNPDILFDPEVQRKGAKIISDTNEKVAKIIGINPAARLTCVKPAGTTSCVLRTASGIHPQHARRYFRMVTANDMEFPAQEYARINPLMVERSVWSNTDSDVFIRFPCEVPAGSILKNDLSALDLLEKVKLTQQNWVSAGTHPERSSNEKVRHNVSNTVTVLPDEWEDVAKYIYKYRDSFAGVSLLSSSGDMDYEQAPFTTVYTPKEIERMFGDASVFSSGLIVHAIEAFSGNLWSACNAVMGIRPMVALGDEPKYPKTRSYKALASYFEARDEYDKLYKQHDWVRRANQFAERYFDGDIKKMTYCLKAVSNWKLWCDITREYEPIDWSKVVEPEPFLVDANTTGAQACSGGQCEII